jgi:hypothetical protein
MGPKTIRESAASATEGVESAKEQEPQTVLAGGRALTAAKSPFLAASCSLPPSTSDAICAVKLHLGFTGSRPLGFIGGLLCSSSWSAGHALPSDEGRVTISRSLRPVADQPPHSPTAQSTCRTPYHRCRCGALLRSAAPARLAVGRLRLLLLLLLRHHGLVGPRGLHRQCARWAIPEGSASACADRHRPTHFNRRVERALVFGPFPRRAPAQPPTPQHGLDHRHRRVRLECVCAVASAANTRRAHLRRDSAGRNVARSTPRACFPK